MLKALTASVLGCLTLFLVSCTTIPEKEQTVEVITQEVMPPKPILPAVDIVKMRDVDWIIITPENADEIFGNMKGTKVLFSISTEDYEKLALNISDIRTLVQQQKQIIIVYESLWE